MLNNFTENENVLVSSVLVTETQTFALKKDTSDSAGNWNKFWTELMLSVKNVPVFDAFVLLDDLVSLEWCEHLINGFAIRENVGLLVFRRMWIMLIAWQRMLLWRLTETMVRGENSYTYCYLWLYWLVLFICRKQSEEIWD